MSPEQIIHAIDWPVWIVGLLLVFAGRRMVWLAVAALGFGVGWWLGAELASDHEQTRWILAALLGCGGAVLALVLKRLAISVGGALLGGFLVSRFLPELEPVWVLVAIAGGALVGAVLAGAVFAVAVALLTAGTGALLLVGELEVSAPVQLVFVLAVTALGSLVQLRRGSRAQPSRRPRASKGP